MKRIFMRKGLSAFFAFVLTSYSAYIMPSHSGGASLDQYGCHETPQGIYHCH
jgi:hypothetical protein